VAEATDVAALAREVVALAAGAARSGDVEVRYDGPEGAAVARCDGAQMRQVVWNLVRNAMQSSPAGSTVTVRVKEQERELVLSVDDQGPGVPEDAGSRIFDESFTTRSGGAGIGLAVVRRIMEDHQAMGATLAVERASGGGASFQVTLSREISGLRRSIRP
jgi:signal transduction histidine kinase